MSEPAYTPRTTDSYEPGDGEPNPFGDAEEAVECLRVIVEWTYVSPGLHRRGHQALAAIRDEIRRLEALTDPEREAKQAERIQEQQQQMASAITTLTVLREVANSAMSVDAYVPPRSLIKTVDRALSALTGGK